MAKSLINIIKAGIIAVFLTGCSATQQSRETVEIYSAEYVKFLMALTATIANADKNDFEFAESKLLEANAYYAGANDDEKAKYLEAKFHLQWRQKNFEKALTTLEQVKNLNLTSDEKATFFTTLTKAYLHQQQTNKAIGLVNQVPEAELRAALNELITQGSKNLKVLPDPNTQNSSSPIVRIVPQFPMKAVKEGRQGSVALEFTITKEGRTKDIQIVYSSDTIFNKNAERAVSKWRYKPRTVNGVVVEEKKVLVKLDFHFAS